MNRRKLLHLTLALPAAGAVLASVPARAQKKGGKSQVVTVKGKKGPAAKGNDPNVKSNSETNERGAKAPAPPAKGGPAAKGGYGTVPVDNRTNLYVRVFLDGDDV